MEHRNSPIDIAGITTDSRSDGVGNAAGRYGSGCWPSQLNIVDVSHEQTGEFFGSCVEREINSVIRLFMPPVVKTVFYLSNNWLKLTQSVSSVYSKCAFIYCLVVQISKALRYDKCVL